ncbi:hypothetical protein EJB05_13715, partial [Eragrostis curvula]
MPSTAEKKEEEEEEDDSTAVSCIRRGTITATGEPAVDVAAVELPRPPRKHQRRHHANNRHIGDDHERRPEAPRPDAGAHRRARLPPRRAVVQPSRELHVERRRGERDEVVERGEVAEPEHLGDDGEQHRPLRAEAEPGDQRGRVEAVARSRGDERVAGAGEEEHCGEGQRAGDSVTFDDVLRAEAGDHAAGVVGDVGEGDEHGDGGR